MDQEKTVFPQPFKPLNREEAYQILLKFVKNENLIKHCLAAEAVMKTLYRYIYRGTPLIPEDEEKWGITGLLHDADYEMAKGRPEMHGLLLFEKLTRIIPEDITYAIKAHNYEKTLVLPKSKLDWSIACCDQLTGLIIACALIHPDKKLNSLTTEFILKKYNEKSFAKGADRLSISRCEEKLEIPLPTFIALNLTAMQQISTALGL